MLMQAERPGPGERIGRLAAWVAVAGAAASFAAALISQYGFDMRPCELCIWQRFPYVIGIVLALPALFLSGAARRALLILAALVFLAGAAIAVFHSGVEFGWWKGFESCSAPSAAGLTAAELIEQLKGVAITRCDDREPFFLELSMANWNVLVSTGIAACLAFAAITTKRRRA